MSDHVDSASPLDIPVMRGDRVWWVVPMRQQGDHAHGLSTICYHARNILLSM